jgi:endogenous inhibitor of DNA gyrase (YacG/DUF329 family)
MWCQHCRQDVPAIGSNVERTFCCARCGTVFMADQTGESYEGATASPSGEADLLPTVPAYDDWEISEELKHVERILKAVRPLADSIPKPDTFFRIDKALGSKKQPPQQAAPEPGAKRPFMIVLAWSLLALGVIGLSCGSVLAAWGVFAARDELWSRGLPIIMLGQVALVIGLVLQLVALKQAPKQSSTQPAEIEDQLAAIQARLNSNRP